MDKKLVSCPYNQNHKIASAKYVYHLMTCKDKLKVGHLFTQCEFNCLHIIRRDSIIDHYQICEDKEKQIALCNKLKGINNLRYTQKEEDAIKEQGVKQEKIENGCQLIMKQQESKIKNQDEPMRQNRIRHRIKNQQDQIKIEDKCLRELQQSDSDEDDETDKENEGKQKKMRSIFDCLCCAKTLKKYMQSDARSPEIDKLIRKFDSLNASLIKIEEQ